MVAAGDSVTLDRDVRVAVYRKVVDDGRPPTPPEIARDLGLPIPTVEETLRRLADAHVLVLAPGTPYVWMANPFSAIPTPFAVRANERDYWANCIWDALGIPACLDADARVDTWCPDCAEPLSLAIRDGELEPRSGGVIHFAVPAARWWDDIGST
jgi:alkylmercury lyase-like protein